MTVRQPYFSDDLYDDEHFADFKRNEPRDRRISHEHVLNLVHKARHLGRRLLSYRLRQLLMRQSPSGAAQGPKAKVAKP